MKWFKSTILHRILGTIYTGDTALLALTAHKGKQWVKVCCHDRAADLGRGTVLQHTPARREQLVHKGDWLATRRNFRNRNILKVTYCMCFKCHRVHISRISHFQIHEIWPLFRVHPLMSKFSWTKRLQMAANLRKPRLLNPKHTFINFVRQQVWS